MTSTTTVQFTQVYSVNSLYDFFAAGGFAGGYVAGDVVALPSAQAAILIAKGICQTAPAPAAPATPPTMVHLCVQSAFRSKPTLGQPSCDYLAGDKGYFPSDYAATLVAAGLATVITP